MPRNIKLGYTNKETLVTLYFHQVSLKCSHVGNAILIEGSFTENQLLLIIMSKVIQFLSILSMRNIHDKRKYIVNGSRKGFRDFWSTSIILGFFQELIPNYENNPKSNSDFNFALVLLLYLKGWILMFLIQNALTKGKELSLKLIAP